MVSVPIVEGEIPFDIPSIKKKCFTWYKLVGELSADTTPLICLHGGPGSNHRYLVPFERLWTTKKIPVILYDQMGCGNSTSLPETNGDEKFWTVRLLVDEFFNLVKHLGLQKYNILGSSWGGALAAEVAADKPSELEKLLLFSPLASTPLDDIFRHKLVDDLPKEHREVFLKQDRDEEYDKKDFEAAIIFFLKKHAYRDADFPGKYFGASLEALMNGDTTVSDTMGGTKWMSSNGTLAKYEIAPRLHDIEVPVLLVDGEFDYVVVKPYFDGVKKIRWVTFAGASHLSFLESISKDKVFKLVEEFLGA